MFSLTEFSRYELGFLSLCGFRSGFRVWSFVCVRGVLCVCVGGCVVVCVCVCDFELLCFCVGG
jgi:hypothetical protein